MASTLPRCFQIGSSSSVSKVGVGEKMVLFLTGDDTDFDLGLEGGKGGGCRVGFLNSLALEEEDCGDLLGFGGGVLLVFGERKESLMLLTYIPVSDIVFE